MTVPGDKATFVGGEDRPDVTSAPRVVMGGSDAPGSDDDRVSRFLKELAARDVHKLRSWPSPDKASPDYPKDFWDTGKTISDLSKAAIDTILYVWAPGGKQPDEEEMRRFLNAFPLLHRQVQAEIEAVWDSSASPKK